MTPDEFAEKMREIYPWDNRYDPEVAHETADELLENLLIAMGYGEGIAIYQQAEKWYE